jgi:hypothetical protein
MNTDTNTRKSHPRGTAAAIVAAAREARGLHQSADVPTYYRVGREIVGRGELSGYGVAYPPKFAAAHMPYATTTRQLKRGFVILTEAEAAEIALEYVSATGRGREVAAERLASAIARCDQWAVSHPAEADTYAAHKAQAHAYHAETIAKLDKAQARYAKLVPAAPAAEAPAPNTSDRADGSTEPVYSAALSQQLAQRAAAKVMAERAWRQAIVDAAAGGMSHRTIAAAAGCTHPTVAKILTEEAVAAR